MRDGLIGRGAMRHEIQAGPIDVRETSIIQENAPAREGGWVAKDKRFFLKKAAKTLLGCRRSIGGSRDFVTLS